MNKIFITHTISNSSEDQKFISFISKMKEHEYVIDCFEAPAENNKRYIILIDGDNIDEIDFCKLLVS